MKIFQRATLILYCAFHTDSNQCAELVVEANSTTDAGKKARREGWKLNLAREVAICPVCSKLDVTLSDAAESRNQRRQEPPAQSEDHIRKMRNSFKQQGIKTT